VLLAVLLSGSDIEIMLRDDPASDPIVLTVSVVIDFMHSEENGQGFEAFAILLRGRPAESGVRYLQREGVGAIWLRQEGGDAGSLVPVGESLVAMYDWAFLLGTGFIVGIGNGLILGYLMFRSGLVPRGMAILGLIGGPLATASGIAVLLGVIEQQSAPQLIMTIPEILWEASLGLYLTFKGFRPSPILSGGIGAAGVGVP